MLDISGKTYWKVIGVGSLIYRINKCGDNHVILYIIHVYKKSLKQGDSRPFFSYYMSNGLLIMDEKFKVQGKSRGFMALGRISIT